MNDDAERIPVDDGYLRALGRATYNFTRLEWGIMWLAEVIEPGSLRSLNDFSAGVIADRFIRVVDGVADDDGDIARLDKLAMDFKELAKERNRLLHGTHHTASDGEQRLKYRGKLGKADWTVENTIEFANKAARAEIEASQLLNSGRYAAYLRSKTSSSRSFPRSSG